MSENVVTSIRHGARTIGDILLELGFVDRERLDAAFERQQVTGQPIGQVLVEVGAITRLELATALAEQWADPSSPGPRWLDDPRTPEPRRAAVDPDHASAQPLIAAEPSGLAPRVTVLEAAVSELRALDDQPYLAQLQDAVVELARRSAGSEAAAAELAERVESSTAALARLQQLDAEAADTAQRLEAVAAGVDVAVRDLQSGLAQIGETMDRLSLHIDEVAATSVGADALDELRAALEDVALRPAGDPTLSHRLGELVQRVDALPGASELDELREAIAELAARPAGDPLLADALAELRDVVESRPDGQEIGELSKRVDALAARPPGDPDAAARFAALQERLDGLAAELAVRDGDAELLAELGEGVAALTRRMEALSTVAAAGVDTEGVEALKSALDELAGRPSGDPTVEARIDTLVEHIALLPDAAELHELRDTVAALAARPSGDPELGGRVEALSSSVEALVAADTSARIDELARQLDELASRRVNDRETTAGLEQLQKRLGDGLARVEGLDERIGAIEARADDSGRDEAQQARLEEVAESLARLERALVELAQSAPVGDRAIEALVDRLALLERDRVGGDDLERVASAVEMVRSEVHERLSSIAAELGGLDGRLRGLTARPALEPEAEARVARLELQIGELAGNVARQAASGERRVAGSALTGDAAEDIERIRMSIERLGHTIGEQGRAIAELMKMQGGNDVVQRLTSRVEALEDGGVAAPGEGGTPGPGLGTLTRRIDDTDAAVEKLLTQLERMGSSLEWRFRRLEELVGGG